MTENELEALRVGGGSVAVAAALILLLWLCAKVRSEA